MDEDHFLHLTDIGREVATSIYERHCFFTEQLIAAGVDPKTAEADACRMEHVISTESFLRLKEATEQEFKQYEFLCPPAYRLKKNGSVCFKWIGPFMSKRKDKLCSS